MKNFFALLLLAGMLWSCAKVPITGRKQLNLLPESQMMAMSDAQYDTFLMTNSVVPISNSHAEMVQKVGNKMARAVEEYLKKDGTSARVRNFEWEFNLVKNDQVNAWCMPGGKVVFYTGIIPITLDEEGIAVVMSHEIAHAVARHGNERISQQLAIQMGGMSLNKATEENPTLARNIFLQAYGIGTTLGALKFSRNQESEADMMGLVFMEVAGYDSNSAIKFWERMSAAGGAKPPELLSTHPSDEDRIKVIKEYIPLAKKLKDK